MMQTQKSGSVNFLHKKYIAQNWDLVGLSQNVVETQFFVVLIRVSFGPIQLPPLFTCD